MVDPCSKVRAALAEGTDRPLDTLIAAQALSLGVILVTSNRKAYQRVSGLAVEDWP